jgi:hypothetical protein
MIVNGRSALDASPPTAFGSVAEMLSHITAFTSPVPGGIRSMRNHNCAELSL